MKCLCTPLIWLALGANVLPAELADADDPMQPGQFAGTWESLSQYECPEWFRDAKLGIWAIIGPLSALQTIKICAPYANFLFKPRNSFGCG